MVSQEFIFGVLLFATVTALALAMSNLVFRRDPVVRRLRGDAPVEAPRATTSREMVVPLMQRVGQAAAKPFMPKSALKQSTLRRQLMNAGIYSASAMELIVGLKVILLAIGAVIGYA